MRSEVSTSIPSFRVVGFSGYRFHVCGVLVLLDAARRDFTTQSRLPENEFVADSFTAAADRAA